jgi:hypothetical protein
LRSFHFWDFGGMVLGFEMGGGGWKLGIFGLRLTKIVLGGCASK